MSIYYFISQYKHITIQKLVIAVDNNTTHKMWSSMIQWPSPMMVNWFVTFWEWYVHQYYILTTSVVDYVRLVVEIYSWLLATSKRARTRGWGFICKTKCLVHDRAAASNTSGVAHAPLQLKLNWPYTIPTTINNSYTIHMDKSAVDNKLVHMPQPKQQLHNHIHMHHRHCNNTPTIITYTTHHCLVRIIN